MGMMCGLFSRAAASASRRNRWTKRGVRSQMRRQQFDRNSSVVGRRVIRAPHLAHAAAAEQLDKAITPERRALHRLTIRSQPHHGRANQLLPLLLRGGHRLYSHPSPADATAWAAHRAVRYPRPGRAVRSATTAHRGCTSPLQAPADPRRWARRYRRRPMPPARRATPRVPASPTKGHRGCRPAPSGQSGTPAARMAALPPRRHDAS